MAERQLSVRSDRARDLAHRLASKERRTVSQVVERALEFYARQADPQESAAAFYARVARENGTDIALDVLIREDRSRHAGPRL